MRETDITRTGIGFPQYHRGRPPLWSSNESTYPVASGGEERNRCGVSYAPLASLGVESSSSSSGRRWRFRSAFRQAIRASWICSGVASGWPWTTTVMRTPLAPGSWITCASRRGSLLSSSSTTRRGSLSRSFRLPLVWPAALESEEHTSELQSRENLVCRLLLEET